MYHRLTPVHLTVICNIGKLAETLPKGLFSFYEESKKSVSKVDVTGGAKGRNWEDIFVHSNEDGEV